jgi:serpin B
MNIQRLRIITFGVAALALIAGSSLAGISQVYSGSADMQDLVAGNNAFAFDLYHALGSGDNLIFSPYSVSLALAMTYAGARGETERQMADTLHFTLPQDQLHPAFKALDESLPRDAGGTADESFRLSIANALWGQDGYPFRPAFIDLLKENYGAGLQLVDFTADPEAARLRINDWVSEQTAQRIQDLLKQGMINTATRLVLTNAIYFKAAWLMKFEAEVTQDGPFTLLDGTQVSVPLMSQQESYAYASGEGYQAVMLSYEGDRIAMVILLPDRESFTAFEGMLDADQFNTIVSSMTRAEVWLTMPRFEIDSEFSLSDTLAALGMPDAFDPNAADFSGMAETDEQLSISAVIHKAFVKVDESGTEAAAATAVVIVGAAAPAEPIEVRVDHPFIYAIYDQDTGTILFLGRVLNPAG